MAFVHLHVHTEYSLLDGACRIAGGSPEHPGLFEHIKSLGQTACAITDHGVMYGVVDFYRAAKSAGIKPIIGCEVYLAPRGHRDKVYEYDTDPYHLVLLCENETGYHNLCKLVSIGFVDGFYSKPRVDTELLARYHEGLICLTACLSGEIPRLLLQEQPALAKQALLRLRDIFGADRLYVELQDHGLPEQKRIGRQLLQLAEECALPIVATNDAHYVTHEDAYYQDVLLCVQTAATVNDDDRMKFGTNEFYLKSEEQMRSLFPAEAIDNTVVIAERCQFDFVFGEYHLPAFPLPEGWAAADYLAELCDRGFAERYDNPPPEYHERLRYELDMIERMGFVEYFLIVGDFMAYARDQGIPIGPGRGSAPGSMCAYCLGITGIDPMRYGLYFERFLNPERVSMPDIDIDFCVRRRGEMIDYVTDKYGEDHVAQVVAFGTLRARAAVKDVGRALGYSYGEADMVSKAVPFSPTMTLGQALRESPELRGMYDTQEKVKALIDTARVLEGMPRNTTTHAAGVVITAGAVSDFIPLAKNDESIVTQFPKDTLESLGLLKMDFLGLRNLTVIHDAEALIIRSHPEYGGIPESDADTFALLGEGRTGGVFQLESEGMTDVCVQLRPQSIEDIGAVIALYRPGPMAIIPRFVRGKQDPDSVVYKHPSLIPILQGTYGCIVYQEHVLEVLRKLGGFTMGHADLVRRAMSKKKFELLAREETAFIQGCRSQGIEQDTAESIWSEIIDFANYGFNKPHAISYAIIAFQTAYLKTHYPQEYMAALLTSVLDHKASVQHYIGECADMGIAVLPPDINESESGFILSERQGEKVIRFGLVAVKNVGRKLIDDIVNERRENGPFATFADFVSRTVGLEINKRAVESLIKCGAFDSLAERAAASGQESGNRRQLLFVYEHVLESFSRNMKTTVEGQLDLFGQHDVPTMALPLYTEYPLSQLLEMERETTGLYLSGHPLDAFSRELAVCRAVPLRQIKADTEQKRFPDGCTVRIAGFLSGVKRKTTKKGSMMAYATLEDKTDSLELLVFSSVIGSCGSNLADDMVVFVTGKLSIRDEREPQVLVDDIQPLHIFQSRPLTAEPAKPAASGGALYIKLPTRDGAVYPVVMRCLSLFPGETKTVLYFEDTQKKLVGSCRPDLPLREALALLTGAANVVLSAPA